MRNKSRWLAGFTAISLAIGMSLFGGVPAPAAQERPDSLGKDFWVTFTRNYDTSGNLSIFISGPAAATGTVAVPGLSWSQDFAVTPGVVSTVDVPMDAMLGLGGDGKAEAKGIHVTSTAEVSVYGLNRRTASTDAYLGLPTNVLGTDYTALAYDVGYNDSEIAILATDDATGVTFVPTANTESGIAAGTSTTVTLNKGDALPVSSPNGDLTGTHITATKPIAVYGGHQCANVPSIGTSACDHIVEQIPPTSTWGQSFLTVPLKTRHNGDTFRFLASADNTAVSVNGSVVATLDAGEFRQRIIDGPATVTADKPILVAQFSNGTDYDDVTSDPFMMLISPAEQFLTQYTFTTPATGFRLNFVNVVTPTAQVGQVVLDGTAVPATEFTQIGGSEFSGAQLDLTAGSHSMTSPKGFGIYVYGFDNFDSYGYPGGAAYAPINELTALTMTPASQKVTVGSQACVTTKASDQNGKGLPGIEFALQVSGVNTATTAGLTDENGESKYCYTSSQPGTDTLTATYGGAQAVKAAQQLTASATVEWATPTVTPTEKPAKAKKLPIHAKKVKGAPVSLGTSDHVVLVKSITTNQHGTVAVRAFCTPLKPAAAGEVLFCNAKVSRHGKVTVTTTGYTSVKVVVKAKATPKKGQSEAWLPATWRSAWKVTS